MIRIEILLLQWPIYENVIQLPELGHIVPWNISYEHFELSRKKTQNIFSLKPNNTTKCEICIHKIFNSFLPTDSIVKVLGFPKGFWNRLKI